MTQYIDKDALVAEIERRKQEAESNCGGYKSYEEHRCNACTVDFYEEFLEIINTLEVKEVGIAIPNIDDLLEEDGINPYSRDAKLFKECYYTALERYKEKKGII